MKYLHLIWAALARSKARTVLTLLSVFAAFLLFGLLDAVRVAFNSGTHVVGADRLIVTSKLSIAQALPYRLQAQIARLPGVKAVSNAAWFGGVYQESKNFFPTFAVGTDYLSLYPEYQIAPEQVRAFGLERNGAVVGEALARQYGWRIGDHIPLQATIFPTRGSNTWEFKLVGIFKMRDPTRQSEENRFLFHWKYFDEANDYLKGYVHWYVVDVANPDQVASVSRAIDALSEHSERETKTQLEQSFNRAFVKQFADVGQIVTMIMGAVFFTLLLLAGNTMAQAVRERVPELAVLKTIGFSNRSVLCLVLAEAIALILLGGLMGMATAALLIPGLNNISHGFVSLETLPLATWALGVSLMTVIGIVVGLPPVLRAMRLHLTDALAGR